jgi:hypothetical protein
MLLFSCLAQGEYRWVLQQPELILAFRITLVGVIAHGVQALRIGFQASLLNE